MGYNPKQPRNSDGEWASGGASGNNAGGGNRDLAKQIADQHVYHATSEENLSQIASGSLKTHGPRFGTDQSSWPDGSKKRRSYWTHDPEIAKSFHPIEGKPVLVRTTRKAAAFKQESYTRDLYAEKAIAAKKLEFLHSSGKWRKVK